jgi:hypothetical protein
MFNFRNRNADYCSVIAKAVHLLGQSTVDARHRVYERARTAVLAEMNKAYARSDGRGPFHLFAGIAGGFVGRPYEMPVKCTVIGRNADASKGLKNQAFPPPACRSQADEIGCERRQPI